MLFQKSALLNQQVDMKGREQLTPFHTAIEHSRVEIAEMILKKYTDWNIDLNTRDLKMFTPFHTACEGGQPEIVKLLLNYSEFTNLNITALGKSNF